jgi:hypothetical protein
VAGGEYARAFGNASAGRYPAGVPNPRQFPRILEALERIDSIRKTLPASLAAAAIDGLLRANDDLRNTPAAKEHTVPETPPTSASQLGRNYRLGALDREQRAYDHHVNAVGARFASGGAPEAGLSTCARLACFDPADQAILGTLRKVLDGDEYSKLDAKQKLRVMGRTIRRQLHEAEHLSRKVKDNGGGDGDGDGGGEDDSTVGDSCRSGDTPDSRKSSETYERDSFCACDSELSMQSGSVTNSDSEGDDDRAEKRANSNNSLGTPTPKKNKAETASASPSKKAKKAIEEEEEVADAEPPPACTSPSAADAASSIVAKNCKGSSARTKLSNWVTSAMEFPR